MCVYVCACVWVWVYVCVIAHKTKRATSDLELRRVIFNGAVNSSHSLMFARDSNL